MNVSFTGNTFVSVNNPQQIVAYVQHGLSVVSDGHGNTYKSNLGFLQCKSENPGLIGGTTTTLGSDSPQPTFRFQEGFNNAWKPKNISFMTHQRHIHQWRLGIRWYRRLIRADQAQNVRWRQLQHGKWLRVEQHDSVPTQPTRRTVSARRP